jgi:hypothetical protein
LTACDPSLASTTFCALSILRLPGANLTDGQAVV